MNYEELDPGIRATVKWLHECGFHTVDSGDGVSKPEMACALPYPHVVILPARPETMVLEADQLHARVAALGLHPVGPIARTVSTGDIWIQASYDPADRSAVIMLAGLNDEKLRQAQASHSGA